MATANIIRFYFNFEGDFIPFNSIGGEGYPRRKRGINPAIIVKPPQEVEEGYYLLHVGGGHLLPLQFDGNKWVGNPSSLPEGDWGKIPQVYWESWEELL